jgi:CMP-N-acetylneuraminic acid synthetase
MTISALLPMKKNSERIKDKNLKLLDGRPLFFYIADTLKKSNIFKNLIVNTDSNRIKEEVKKRYNNWAVVIDRDINICGDFVSMNKIIASDLGVVDEEHFLQTHSTNPLLTVKTIKSAIKIYFENLDTYDSLYSVNKIQARLFDKRFRPLNHKKNDLIRTQDLDPIYEENSNIYIFSKASFVKSNKNRIGENPYLFSIDKNESIDIDNKDDFILAEALIKYNSF